VLAELRLPFEEAVLGGHIHEDDLRVLRFREADQVERLSLRGVLTGLEGQHVQLDRGRVVAVTLLMQDPKLFGFLRRRVEDFEGLAQLGLGELPACALRHRIVSGAATWPHEHHGWR
jgi:hypothetical protein